MRNITTAFLFFSLFGFCFQKTHDEAVEAKSTVKKIFRLSFEKKYDSLSLFMPERYFKNAKKDYQSIVVKPMAEAIKVGDFPSDSNLKFEKKTIIGMAGHVVTFYPDRKLSKVDSIRFFFIEPFGFKEVYLYEVFEPLRKIKIVTPPGYP